MAKYKQWRVDKIIERLRQGLPREASYQAGGIGHETFYEWLRVHPDFALKVDEAEIAYLNENLQYIKDAAPKDWKAASWLTERHPKWKKLYAQRSEQEIDLKLPYQINIEKDGSTLNGKDG